MMQLGWQGRLQARQPVASNGFNNGKLQMGQVVMPCSEDGMGGLVGVTTIVIALVVPVMALGVAS